MHPADRDYSQQNAPNDEDLEAMMESALFLAEMAQGKGRRRVDGEGRGLARQQMAVGDLRLGPMRMIDGTDLIDGEMVAVDDLIDFARDGMPIYREETKPSYSATIFSDAIAAAEAERGSLSPVDSLMVEQAIAVIREWVGRLRQLEAVQTNLVLGHALNSIDLGLIGLAKVKGNEGG